MAFITQDWVGETSNSTGTGDLILAGARAPRVTFSSVLSNGDTFEYSASNGTQYEDGKATYNSGANSITRTTVFRSSNANALVNFTTTPINIDLTLTSKRILSPAGNSGADNSDGATITLGDGDTFNLITSTTTITAFALTDDRTGRTITLRFNTIRTITYNATSLILPTGTSIRTAVGDICEIQSLGSGNVRVNWYQRANGSPLAGSGKDQAISVAAGANNDIAVNGGIGIVFMTVTSAADADVTGFVYNGGGAGQIEQGFKLSKATGTGRILIKHEGAGSSAANRIWTVDGLDIILTKQDESVYISRDTNSASRWRVLQYPTSSTTTTGIVELATTTETLTGTDAARAVTPDSLAAYWEKGADNSGGATITLGEGGFFDLITSTTTITALAFTTDKAGRTAQLRFTTARTLTHNATSLILPTGANITTAAGDIATVVSLGSGNFVVSNYQRASGAPLTAAPSQADATITGRALGAGTGAIGALTRLQSGEIIRQGTSQIIGLTGGTTNHDIVINDGVTVVYIGVTGSTDCNITGFQYAGGTPNHAGARIRVINNTGTGRLVFKHNTGSVTSNRIFSPAGGDWFSTYLNETVTLYKDNDNSGAWRIENTFIQPTDFCSTTDVLTGTDTTLAVNSDALAALWEAGADNSGGATITMGEGGSFNLITSTTAITAFAFSTDKAGRKATIRFNTVRTLTHNATSLILPGGANITTAVGDICEVQSLGSGNFRVNSYDRASGLPATPSALVTQSSSLTQTNSTSNITAGTYTIPANTLEVGSEYVFEGIFQAGRTTTATACNVVIEILIGGIVAVTNTIAITTTTTQNRSGQCRGTLTIRTIGSSGTCMVSLQTISDVAGNSGTPTIVSAPSPGTGAPSTTNIDTTVSRTLELRFRMSAAVTAVYTHVLHSSIMKLR